MVAHAKPPTKEKRRRRKAKRRERDQIKFIHIIYIYVYMNIYKYISDEPFNAKNRLKLEIKLSILIPNLIYI